MLRSLLVLAASSFITTFQNNFNKKQPQLVSAPFIRRLQRKHKKYNEEIAPRAVRIYGMINKTKNQLITRKARHLKKCGTRE